MVASIRRIAYDTGKLRRAADDARAALLERDETYQCLREHAPRSYRNPLPPPCNLHVPAGNLLEILCMLMKKVAEAVCNETSATALHGMLCGLGYKVSKATLLDYLAMAREAYLLFEVKNAVAKFVEREGNPKRYFSDNGLLNLFLIGGDPALLENEVAVAMRDAFGEGLHYLKSSKHGIDVDFYVPEQGIAVQVAYSLSESTKPREIGNLLKLARIDESIRRLLIVTKEEEEEIVEGDTRIKVKPAWKFLLQDLV